jgi:uncharacterized protein
VLRVLLKAGADIVARSVGEHLTALHMAAKVGLAEACELLLAQADELLEARDAQGNTALMHAAYMGNLDAVILLLKYGAVVNAANKLGTTALIGASLQQRVRVATCLLKAGADVNKKDNEGYCALMDSVENDNCTLVQLFLKHGADITAKDSKGQNLLFKAAQKGLVDMIDMLVKHGFSVHTTDNSGFSLLTAAVEGDGQQGHMAAAEWLLQGGVAVNATSSIGSTALHLASSKNHTGAAAMVQLLLANGADVNICACNVAAPLDIAAEQCRAGPHCLYRGSDCCWCRRDSPQQSRVYTLQLKLPALQ